MLTKTQRPILCVVALLTAAFAGSSNEARASNHEESPVLGPIIVRAHQDTLVVEVLDWLNVPLVDPDNGPMPQTKEHILLSRQSYVPTPNSPSSDQPEVEYYLLNRREARIVIWVLAMLHDHDDSDPAAVYHVWLPSRSHR